MGGSQQIVKHDGSPFDETLFNYRWLGRGGNPGRRNRLQELSAPNKIVAGLSGDDFLLLRRNPVECYLVEIQVGNRHLRGHAPDPVVEREVHESVGLEHLKKNKLRPP